MISHKRILNLAANLSRRLRQLDFVVEKIDRTLRECAEVPPRGLTMIMGHCLHDFYIGAEDVLESIAMDFEEVPLKSERRHKDLLLVMCGESPLQRPAVISFELEKELETYLGFRHVYRNWFGYQLICPVQKCFTAACGTRRGFTTGASRAFVA